MLFVTQENEIKLKDIQSLYFYNSNMPLHNKMMYVISQIQEKYKNIGYLAIDVDYFHSQCIRFSITSVPALLILQDGKEIKRIEGSVKAQDFIDAFDDICTS
jgi:thiol-disulfide isomerase/thioredoxin